MTEKGGWAATVLAIVSIIGAGWNGWLDREDGKRALERERAADIAEMRCIQEFVRHIADDAKER